MAGHVLTATGGGTIVVKASQSGDQTYAAAPDTQLSIAANPVAPTGPIVLTANQVSTTASGLVYSRVSKTFSGTVTVKNISASAISGPLQIVFTGLPANVTLVGGDGSLSGAPYQTISGVASLAPAQSATVGVRFSNPTNATIKFTPVIYSGSIN